MASKRLMRRLLTRMSCKKILADYNLSKGRFRPLVPQTLLFGPLLAAASNVR
jgi:hypothetical protein